MIIDTKIGGKVYICHRERDSIGLSSFQVDGIADVINL
jgi:hypothetical protein